MNLKEKLSDLVAWGREFALDIFYPKKCVICNSFVNYGNKISICTDCFSKLNRHSGVIRTVDSYYDEVVYAFEYEGNVKEAVTDTKFKNLKYLSKTFGFAIYNAIKEREFIKEVSLICPVPLNPFRDRDYNQSGIIAKTVSEYLSIPMFDDVIIKPVNLEPLSKMGYGKRDYMIKNAFSFNPRYDVSAKTICLIDDIYTTGSTANECAKTLKLWGAKKVYVLAVCCAKQKQIGENTNADSNIAN